MDCPNLPTTIDIGGEIIYLDGTSANINLAYKGRDYFQRVFKPIDGDECILRKYMYHSLESKQKLVFEGVKGLKEKDRLNTILKARSATLWSSINTNSNTVIKNNLLRYYRGITAILQELKGSGKTEDAKPYEQCPNEMELLEKIKTDQDRMVRMLLQTTWYLLHPEDVPSDIQCKWGETVAAMEEQLSIAQVQKTMALPNSVTKKKGFNYFKQIDLEQFGSSPNFKTAIGKAKTMMTTELPNDIMKNRLKQIMTLLSLKNYVKGSLNNPSEANIAKITDTLPSKLVDIGLPLQEAFLPMKSFLRSVYDPVYTLLEERTKKTESLMAILLILLHICNTIPKSETMYGVYRIDGVPPEGLQWVKDQLWNPNEVDAKKDDHAKHMYHLSKLSLPILTDKAGELQTLGTSINTTPYFQFGIMGEKEEAGTNLSIADNSNQKVDEIKKLFPKNALFLIVSKSDGFVSFKSAHTGIPATFYSIDYTKVDPKAPTLTATPVKTFDKGITLDKLITIDPNLACNHSNLVLSIFFLLDSRLASKKPDESATSPAVAPTANAKAAAPTPAPTAKAAGSTPAPTATSPPAVVPTANASKTAAKTAAKASAQLPPAPAPPLPLTQHHSAPLPYDPKAL